MHILRLKKKSQLISSIVNNLTTDEDVIDFCYQWNIRYPLDRWWREKHQVAFNSDAHRRVSFLDIRFEYEEDVIMKKVRSRREYVADLGDWFIGNDNEDRELTQEQKFAKYKKEFDSIDLSQFND